MTHLSWHSHFIALAHLAASRSKDPSTQVGAVIVNSRTREVVSMGFNGFPRGVDDTPERYNDRETKYRFVVHAELNAILHAGRLDNEPHTLYATLSPCEGCAKAIIQAGNIDTVLYDERRFNETTEIMFAEAGVKHYNWRAFEKTSAD